MTWLSFNKCWFAWAWGERLNKTKSACDTGRVLANTKNFKLLMQEAPNSYEKDEQQERGNYDSAVYME